MRTPLLSASAIFVFLPAIALGADNNRTTTTLSAVPGTVNYVEGQASIGTRTLDDRAVGSLELKDGQSLITQKGKVELLLTPGVFLRVGDNSDLKMISASLTDTEVELDRGHAIIEVAQLYPANDIRIDAAGSQTKLLKTGLYDFDLNREQLLVFEGKAEIHEGGQHHTLKGEHEIALDTANSLKPAKFDRKNYAQDDLYNWSSLRSAYVAEANVDAAGSYANSGWGVWGPGWWGAGWYWDPWFAGYTFIPGDGIFYSPFGWGFYSPWFVDWAPFYGFGFGGYGYWNHYYHHFSANARNWGPGNHYVTSSHYAAGTYRGPGSTGAAFHSGSRVSAAGFGRSAGGFHGGGGFHGRGGGGFHGGGGGFHGGGGGHGR